MFGEWDVVTISDYCDILYGDYGKLLYQEYRCGNKARVHQYKTLSS